MEDPWTGDAFNPACPTRTVLDRVGDRWTVLIIEALAAGPLRFGQLRERVGAITPKVLTASLRSLQRDGLIDRTAYAEVPPRVEYALTDLGLSLRTPVAALRTWAEQNVAAIVAHRTRDLDEAQGIGHV
ncbi:MULTISPECIES: winged helix-turn-helix transcriptional regulator [Brevibacterium]|mgnify:CR=1 FL=1|uniref:Helix-turn-helix domain-containing protein n=1 Tax=Brevibacterium salitolerans TaxID=1403566 RepID=A0ABP5ICY3_9MICO|nr:helix-turn-helix domain-containing protein [Brevibacterium sp.]